MDKNKIVQFSIESNINLAPLLGRAIQGICNSTPLDKIEIYQIQLCIVEAINNVILHAYDNKPGNKVEAHFELGPDYIIIKTIDTGKFDNQLGLRDDFTSFDPDHYQDLPESGMGIFIMKSYMDKVEYGIEDGKNVVTMRKNFKEKIVSGNPPKDF